jgi:Tol biopolymer transport system component
MRATWARLCSVVFITMLVAAACRGDDEGGVSGDTPTGGAAAETGPNTAASVPFLLDLATGEETPLPENLVGNNTCGYLPSPDGTRVAYQTCGGGVYGSPEDVSTVANIDGTDVRTLEVPEGLNAYVRAWSPDGTRVAYQLRSGGTRWDVGNLFVHDLSSGEQTQLTHLELTSAPWYQLNMSFTPDGQSVVFHLPRSSSMETEWDVWSVPVTGGEPTLMLRNAAFPSYFPDGKHIAFVVPGTSAFDGHIIAIANEQGSRRTLVEVEPGYRWPSVSPDGSRIAYQVDGSIYVVDVSTGGPAAVGAEGYPEWLDDDTLIVTPPQP